MWDELWIENEIAGDDLARAVAKALQLDEQQIVVVDGIASEPMRTAAVEVYRTKGAGQFATRIQLHGKEPSDRRVFCARLASALSCKVLGDDGSVNAFTFMQYEPGNATRVSVDAQQIEEHAPVVIGPYEDHHDFEDEGHPTKPIRRYPAPTDHRTTRGGLLAHLILEYMVEGLPRPPLTQWTATSTEVYGNLQKLLGTLAYRKASDEEIANIQLWSDKLRAAFPDPEKAGWFVPEVLEAATIVLSEPWDPDQPASASRA
jgi:hypothetical protein